MNDNNLYDVVIIGGGPAGLTAAIYLARARYRVVVVEKEKFGGQITITEEVVNYPGIPTTSGERLTRDMQKQAAAFGAEFQLANALGLEVDGDIKTVKTSKGDFRCFGILLATGARPRSIGFPGEEKFKGRGVAYCATCDGEFFEGMDVFVIGGGYAAAEESVFLTKYARHVTILIRGEDFTCAKATAEKAKNHPDITILTMTEIRELSGDEVPKKLIYENIETGEKTVYEDVEGKGFGVFVFAGYEPATDLIKGIATRNEYGYVETDKSQKTSVDGLYAAGDVCEKNLRQIVTAVGDGAVAATELEKYVHKCQKRTGLKPAVKEGGFSSETVGQLEQMFERMEHSIVLNFYPDDRPVAQELRQYLEDLVSLTNMLTLRINKEDQQEDPPVVKICDANGIYTGLAFHGVPGGHEFTSFVMGIYNAAGPGQAIDEETMNKIEEIREPTDLKILVSLSCSMCPELVIAAQKLATCNEYITAEVYDINYFPQLKEKYHVRSVPCLIKNDEKVSFGRKNLQQLLEWIKDSV